MADYALTADGADLQVIGGDIVVTPSRAASCAQRLQIGLGILLGEWSLDLTEGIPYREEVRVKAAQLEVIRARILQRLLRDPDVAQVLQLELERDRVSRELRVSFRVLVRDGVPGLDERDAVVVGSGGVAQGVPELLCLVEPLGGYL